MEHLYSMKCKNRVPLYDLLLEMLDAHRVHRPERPSELWPQADCKNGGGDGGGGSIWSASVAGCSSGPQSSHSSPSRNTSGLGVLQFGGSRSDCTHLL